MRYYRTNSAICHDRVSTEIESKTSTTSHWQKLKRKMRRQHPEWLWLQKSRSRRSTWQKKNNKKWSKNKNKTNQNNKNKQNDNTDKTNINKVKQNKTKKKWKWKPNKDKKWTGTTPKPTTEKDLKPLDTNTGFCDQDKKLMHDTESNQIYFQSQENKRCLTAIISEFDYFNLNSVISPEYHQDYAGFKHNDFNIMTKFLPCQTQNQLDKIFHSEGIFPNESIRSQLSTKKMLQIQAFSLIHFVNAVEIIFSDHSISFLVCLKLKDTESLGLSPRELKDYSSSIFEDKTLVFSFNNLDCNMYKNQIVKVENKNSNDLNLLNTEMKNIKHLNISKYIFKYIF